ncbi:hypothetical protein M911_07860 [Ectothiorhodospira haloalkaliphila]|uniref:Uncharacterized protein n=1 Tax=Ectothiorhodospira haloalkaliphila TaxID=421628 RepID=W8KNG2_9GAMM|nr:hypothetical protein M911_07860 [Ectothiorhodospira haloalkaliphila]
MDSDVILLFFLKNFIFSSGVQFLDSAIGHRVQFLDSAGGRCIPLASLTEGVWMGWNAYSSQCVKAKLCTRFEELQASPGGGFQVFGLCDVVTLQDGCLDGGEGVLRKAANPGLGVAGQGVEKTDVAGVQVHGVGEGNRFVMQGVDVAHMAPGRITHPGAQGKPSGNAQDQHGR